MTFINVITHLFLPHESNNHKPRILHPHAFLFYIVFLLFLGTTFRTVNKYAPNILGIATNISVSDLLSNTNQKRQEKGLAPLTFNTQLSEAAKNKAADMIEDNYWAHFNPNGKSPWDFIIGSGYRYSFAGENLAKDFDDSKSVVDAWMASTTHRDNLLKPEYQDIGLAVVNGTLNGENTTLVVQMFGTSSENITQTNHLGVSEQVPSITPEEKPQVIIVAGVNRTPVISMNNLNKSISIILLGFLLLVLTLDGFLIWQRKTIRISGHNFAHVIFLTALITAVWLTSSGSIF